MIFDFRLTRVVPAIKHIASCAFVFVVLSQLLTACGRNDTKFSKEIIGTWSQTSLGTFLMTLNTNGSFHSQFSGTNMELNYFGIWVVHNGYWVSTITNKSEVNWAWTNSQNVGKTESAKIVGLDEQHLTLQFNYEKNPQKISYVRKR